MSSLRYLAVLACVATGCDGTPDLGYAVAVTVVPDATVSDEAIAQIRSLNLQVESREPYTKRIPIAGEFDKRQLQLIYRPTFAEVDEAVITIVFVDGADAAVAFGSAPVTIDPSRTVEVKVTVGSTGGQDDGGGGGGPDLKAPPKKLGESCSNGVDSCETGFCVDGLCCNSACGDSCMACNLSGTEGFCTAIGNGAKPVHGMCPALAANDLTKPCSTDGFCNGAGVCRLYAANTLCSSPVCDTVTDQFTPPAVCDGAGRCIVVPAYNCAPYRCKDALACWDTCTVPTQATNCSGANSCVASSCGKLPKGRDCTSGTQCVSGNCIDGVCCTQAVCSGQCEACDADPADKGECKPVSGPPHDIGVTRSACTGDGSGGCGGTCNGVLRTLCTYPSGSCRTQSCSTATGSPVLTLAANCNGAGSCPVATSACTPPPNMVAACDGLGTSCAYSCAANYADCTGAPGCETNIGNDANNCGGCGTVCPLSGQICSNKACQCTGGKQPCVGGGVCYTPGVAQCCAPDGTNGCGCNRTTCHQFICGGFCFCRSWNYSCSGGGSCTYTFADPYYQSPNCSGYACSFNPITGATSQTFYCN